MMSARKQGNIDQEVMDIEQKRNRGKQENKYKLERRHYFV